MSQYPKLEGRFPILSGIRFTFDSSKPPGSRIDAKTLLVKNEPIDFNKVRNRKIQRALLFELISFIYSSCTRWPQNAIYTMEKMVLFHSNRVEFWYLVIFLLLNTLHL